MGSSGDKLEFEGIVESSNKGFFNVRVNDNYSVLCTLSGKIRYHDIKVMVSDIVLIEVSPYDTGKGRIVRRLK